MNFETYFIVSSYAFLTTGFIALALTDRLDAGTILLYIAGLVASLAVERRAPERRITLRTALLLSALAVPVFTLDAMFASGPFLALAHFILFMSVVKLFQEKNDADWVWIYAIAFFEMLLAASLTIDITFVVSLVLFLFFFVTTLGAFEIHRSHRIPNVSEEDHATKKSGPRPLRRVGNLLGVAGGQVVIVALVATPIFFLLPRFSGGALGSGLGQPQNITGFSDTVRLGDVTRIKESDAVVMHVKLDREPGRWLRWRGLALETFDGRQWREAAPSFKVVPTLAGTRTYQIDKSTGPDEMLTQTVILEGITTDAVFAASRAITAEGKLPELRADATRSLRSTAHPGTRIGYTVFSDLAVPSAEELAADTSQDYVEPIRTVDLQLPEIDPRVGELAREVVGDASTPYEKARRVEQFLKTKYTYSLDLRRSDTSIDPVADFLLNTKTGQCEYFASAMVLMLRELGVPARVVNGFQMGEYNSIGDVYVVRQADAHSWAEVYFARSQRWIEFDPTPPAGINHYGDVSLADHARRAMEAAQIFWIRYVVGLDDREQVTIMRTAQSRLLRWKAWLVETKNAWRDWAFRKAVRAIHSGAITRERVVALCVLVALAGASAFAAFVLHGRGWTFAGFVLPVWRLRRLRGGREPSRSAVVFYEQMAALLAGYGLARRPDETPREFAEATGLDEVRAITEHYHRARYGGASGAGDERDVAAAMSRLAARLRRERPAPRTDPPPGRGGSRPPKDASR